MLNADLTKLNTLNPQLTKLSSAFLLVSDLLFNNRKPLVHKTPAAIPNL